MKLLLLAIIIAMISQKSLVKALSPPFRILSTRWAATTAVRATSAVVNQLFLTARTSNVLLSGSSPAHLFSSRRSTTSSGSTPNDSAGVVLDPLVVCGPSGVGKGTIIERFMKDCDWAESSFGFGVSHTTRAPRKGEVHGQHYVFVSPDSMKSLVAQGYFVESAEVHGNLYGTSWQAIRTVQEAGKRCLLDIDVQGVQRFKGLVETEQATHSDQSRLLQPKFIFIAPPSVDVLEKRLQGRGSESEETLQRRIGNARAELEYGLASGNFDRVVVNDDLESAVRDFEEAVKDLYKL
jgi:guanylate kinase